MRAQSNRAWLGTVLTVALGATYLGCAGTKPPERVTPMAATYQSEIVAMMTEIRGWRVELKLGLEPTDRVLGSVDSARNVCPVFEVVDECRDICTLADHICENADKICGLAEGELLGDQWAQDKCSSAKASCKEGRKQCCGCQDDAAKAADGGAVEPE